MSPVVVLKCCITISALSKKSHKVMPLPKEQLQRHYIQMEVSYIPSTVLRVGVNINQLQPEMSFS